jgi:hypothetical protein
VDWREKRVKVDKMSRTLKLFGEYLSRMKINKTGRREEEV